ncbi:MAG: signal peptide peptidase SppA [candidate division WOR-3 bacterium]
MTVVIVFVVRLAAQVRPGTIGYLEIEGTIVDSRETIRQLRELDNNPSVRGILLRVESPGGVVTPAHEIYSELKRIRNGGKKIVVSMGSVAASGGYYVSTPADVIVANPTTLTGSIGVIMELPVLRGLLDKVGVKVEVVKSAANKDVGSPFRDMTDSDRRLLGGVVSDVYENFVEVVSVERDLPLDSVRTLADGRLLTGRQALGLGLVDTLGTLTDAKRLCADLCGISVEPKMVRPRPRLRYWLDRFLETATERLLGMPRFPRLSYRCY